jgi:hypothetical protein
MAEAGRVAFSDDGMAMAELGTLSLYVIAKPLTLERVLKMRTLGDEHNARFGASRASMTVAEPAAVHDMPKEIREAAAKIVRELPVVIKATVIEGGGFRAVAARAIVTGVHLLSRRGGQDRIFGDVDTAMDWLVPRLPAAPGVSVDIPALAELIARARGAVRR